MTQDTKADLDQSPDPSERSFDAVCAVAKRLLAGWMPMERGSGMISWRKRSWNPARWEEMTSEEWQALQHLDWSPDSEYG